MEQQNEMIGESVTEVRFVFSDIDFLSGKVDWICDSLEGDMLSVEYPNNYDLFVDWCEHEQTFYFTIIRDNEYDVPVVKYIATNAHDMRILFIQAVNRIEEESKKGRPYYGGLWKTEVVEL